MRDHNAFFQKYKKSKPIYKVNQYRVEGFLLQINGFEINSVVYPANKQRFISNHAR